MSKYKFEEIEQFSAELEDFIHKGHIQDEANNSIICNYFPF
tara:strand:- start:73 stop:195 length:123 start_codon:yes stop_codon:yes gene_type:complete